MFPTNARDFDLFIHTDIIDTHRDRQHCPADAPCAIVQRSQTALAALEDGTARVFDPRRSVALSEPVTAHHRPVAGQRSGRGYVRKISPEQLDYLRALLAGKDRSSLGNLQAQIVADAEKRLADNTLSLQIAKDAISFLVGCPDRPGKVRLVTEPMVNFINSLVEQKQALHLVIDWPSVEDIPFDVGRQLIDMLKEMPAPQRTIAPVKSELVPGVYKRGNGDIVRIYKARHGSHLLSTKLVDATKTGYQWEYIGGANRAGVSLTDKISIDEARQYGLDTGWCICCGLRLTDPNSIAYGIGPICRAKYA